MGVFDGVDVTGVLLALPFGLLALFSVAATMGFLHFVFSAAAADRTLRDRLERLGLALFLPIVPIATLGYAKPTWHAHVLVRAAEVGVGLALFAVLAYYIWALWRQRSVPGAVNYAPTARARVSESLHGISLAAVCVFSSAAFVAHGLGWLAYELR